VYRSNCLMPKTSRKRAGPKSATNSPVQACPAEIWGNIFSLACVDDGFTGRSLSRVSKYIKECSKPYKYQCLSVKDHQLRPLTTVLKKLSPELKRVIHLFLSSKEWDSGQYRLGEFFQADKNRLLMVVAPTLKSLEIGCHYQRIYLPFAMPALMDLTLHGFNSYHPLPYTVACYPALRRLNMEWTHTSGGSKIINFFKTAAPNLSELRLSTSYVGTQSALEATLHLKKVLLETYTQFGGAFQGIMARRTGILILLKYRPPTSPTVVAAKNHWMDVCAGCADHWNPTEEEVETNIIADSDAD
jgi:hypothetical protein